MDMQQNGCPKLHCQFPMKGYPARSLPDSRACRARRWSRAQACSRLRRSRCGPNSRAAGWGNPLSRRARRAASGRLDKARNVQGQAVAEARLSGRFETTLLSDSETAVMPAETGYSRGSWWPRPHGRRRQRARMQRRAPKAMTVEVLLVGSSLGRTFRQPPTRTRSLSESFRWR